LGASENAAQKRLTRAVERLREFFAKRGVTVGASGLTLVISANAVQAAPFALGASISAAAALVESTSAASSVMTKGILLVTFKQKIATAAAIALFLALGGIAAHLLKRPTDAPIHNGLLSNPQGGGLELRWIAEDSDASSPIDLLPDGSDRTGQRKVRVSKEIVLNASHIESATLITDEPGRKEISVSLNQEASRSLEQATADHLGHKLAIVWNGRVISTPVVRSPIRGPSLSVSGLFSDGEIGALMDALSHR